MKEEQPKEEGQKQGENVSGGKVWHDVDPHQWCETTFVVHREWPVNIDKYSPVQNEDIKDEQIHLGKN
ncbi:MAG TPA: hypothetical protein PK511_12610 [Chitinophagales bacterium]|nr:hypothetical protein [Cyclobacteriaceae bacterium]HNI55359.1 hypothetical protein [Chitinophagales bacterium]